MFKPKLKLFPSRGYITMQDFAYNINLLACMSFPSSESYIYVKKMVVMSINVHVSESFC